MRSPTLRRTLLLSVLTVCACGPSIRPSHPQDPLLETQRSQARPVATPPTDTGPPPSDVRVPSPVSKLRVGMTEAQAEAALGVSGGPRSHCHGYGDYEVQALCVSLAYKHGVLSAVVLLFDNPEEAHKELTSAWGAPLQKGNRELWLGAPGATPTVQAWLFPYGEGARLELRDYIPVGELFGGSAGKLAISGHRILGAHRPDIRGAFGSRADCPQVGFCTVLLPGTDYAEDRTAMHLDTRGETVTAATLTLPTLGDQASADHVLHALETAFGPSNVASSGYKDTLRFAQTPEVRVERQGGTFEVCLGACP